MKKDTGIMSDEGTPSEFTPGGGGQQQGRTYDDLFRLLESLRGEFAEFRVSVEERLPTTAPFFATLEAVNAAVGTIALQLKAAGVETAEIGKALSETTKVVAEIAKGYRRIESKVNGVAIDCSEIKGILHDHEVRLQALDLQ